MNSLSFLARPSRPWGLVAQAVQHNAGRYSNADSTYHIAGFVRGLASKES